MIGTIKRHGYIILFIIAGLVFFLLNRPHRTAERVRPILINATKLEQPKGTCAPNTASCQGNPKLCMEQNKNSVCN